MTVNPGDHLRVTLTLNMPLGTVAQNIYYTQVQSLGGGDDATVLDDLRDWMESIYLAYAPIMAPVVQAILMEVSIQALGGVITPVGARTLLIAGNAAAEMVSHGVAGQINMQLEGGGRPSIKFLPGTNEAGIADGEYLAFDIATMGNVALAIILGANAISPLGSYIPGIITGDTQAFKTFTNEIVVKSIPGYQRRRKPGVGI